jgi:hypothetical protein
MHKKASYGPAQAIECAQSEFGQVRLGDRRLNARLVNLAACFLQQPSASIPKACGAWSQSKGGYRFLANPRVCSEKLIEPHLKQTALRMAAEKCVLVVQDTTSLNYGERAGMGLVGTGADGAKGLWLHSSMAFTPAGLSLGLVQVQHWCREPEHFGKAAQRRKRPLNEKESQRWLKSFDACVELAREMPGTQIINVADREGDLYDLFHQAQAHPEVGVLVRARHNRRSSTGQFFDELISAAPVMQVSEVKVPRRPGKKARTAKLELKYQAVTIYRPRTQTEPVKVWIIDAREQGGGSEAIHWRLITNLEIKGPLAAEQYVQLYALRWQIEEYHRVLKSGCRTEARQLETAPALLNALMIDLVVAWRVLQLSRLARTAPEVSASEQFSPQEIQLLLASNRQPKTKTLSLREAVRLVAQLGGFLARARDGEPGAMTLWRGLEVLTGMLKGWELAKRCG